MYNNFSHNQNCPLLVNLVMNKKKNLQLYLDIMLAHLLRLPLFRFRTVEQDTFIRILPTLSFNSDEEVIENVRKVYEKREFLEECEEVHNLVDRLQNYFLKRKNCTVAHLQCYYKLKEMKLINLPFKHNLIRKYYNFLLEGREIKNQHMEKYLWFIFDEDRYERQLFQEAACSHTLNLHEIYEYMNQLNHLPTWEPYIRVATMLKYLGHEIKGHKSLPLKKNIERIQHKYYPYIGQLYSSEELIKIKQEQKYDDHFLTMLCNEYVIKNTSRYDSYLQRIQRVEIEKAYERTLEIMSWSDLTPFIDLVIRNYQLHGVYEDIENHLSELFFRLCEHQNINLESITDILDRFYKQPNFMFFKRNPILERTYDAIASQGIDQYSYFPTDGYLTLLQTTKHMKIGTEAIKRLQSFLCRKMQGKLIWNQGEVQRVKQELQSAEYEGKAGLLSHLASIQEQR